MTTVIVSSLSGDDSFLVSLMNGFSSPHRENFDGTEEKNCGKKEGEAWQP